MTTFNFTKGLPLKEDFPDFNFLVKDRATLTEIFPKGSNPLNCIVVYILIGLKHKRKADFSAIHYIIIEYFKKQDKIVSFYEVYKLIELVLNIDTKVINNTLSINYTILILKDRNGIIIDGYGLNIETRQKLNDIVNSL